MRAPDSGWGLVPYGCRADAGRAVADRRRRSHAARGAGNDVARPAARPDRQEPRQRHAGSGDGQLHRLRRHAQLVHHGLVDAVEPDHRRHRPGRRSTGQAVSRRGRDLNGRDSSGRKGARDERR